MNRKWWWLAAIVAVALVATGAFLRRGTRIQYVTLPVTRGDIKDAVDATGIVNAVVNVQVGSQVSGTIAKLNADFNSRVQKDEVIAEIDPRLLEGALLQSEADLANAKANGVAARANLDKSQAALVQTHADFGRAKALEETSIGSKQALDQAKASYESAKAAVDAARAAVVQADAQVRQKEAAVSVARTNLNYTIIRSPIDGTVVARNVDVGQTVAASLQAPTIFTIAQNLSKMLVYAKVDESDVGRIRPHANVTFKVDAFPKETFTGVVQQIRMNPTTVQNVVTYDAVIEFENRDQKLFPGMTAYVTIPVASVQNVVKLPNAALRFKPPVEAGLVVPPELEKSEHGPKHQESAVVWKLRRDGTIEPIEVALGITDHAYTEVRTGKLEAGDEVVTTAMAAKSSGPPGAVRR